MRSSPASDRRNRLAAPVRILYSAVALAALGLALALPPHYAAAQPQIDPDWPCVQRKVPNLSPASMWPGLSEETLSADWRADPEVASLVARIAPRRVSVENAQEAIRSFAAGLDEEDREVKLQRLFVGLFQTLDAERAEVMRGIGRFARNQTQLAERILADRAALSDARQAAAPGSEEIVERREQLTTAIRVFEDRRASLTHVCEVPRIIEQRLFALARTIQAELS